MRSHHGSFWSAVGNRSDLRRTAVIGEEVQEQVGVNLPGAKVGGIAVEQHGAAVRADDGPERVVVCGGGERAAGMAHQDVALRSPVVEEDVGTVGGAHDGDQVAGTTGEGDETA